MQRPTCGKCLWPHTSWLVPLLCCTVPFHSWKNQIRFIILVLLFTTTGSISQWKNQIRFIVLLLLFTTTVLRCCSLSLHQLVTLAPIRNSTDPYRHALSASYNGALCCWALIFLFLYIYIYIIFFFFLFLASAQWFLKTLWAFYFFSPILLSWCRSLCFNCYWGKYIKAHNL